MVCISYINANISLVTKELVIYKKQLRSFLNGLHNGGNDISDQPRRS